MKATIFSHCQPSLKSSQNGLNFDEIRIIFSFIRLLPESARWLVAKGKKVEAEKTLRKIARINGYTWPENIDLEPLYTVETFNHTFCCKDISLSMFAINRSVVNS